jgi:hypothetical protein
LLDDKPVAAVASTLEPRGRVSGRAHQLIEAAARCFQGSVVLGTGFLLSPEEGQDLINRNPRNADVLFPYLNGEDLNTSPDQSPSRWVINFFDWPLERAETYPECMAIVREKVKPFREQSNRALYRERWWMFAERCPGLYSAIEGLDRALAISLVSKAVMPAFAPTGIVFAHRLGVFAYRDDSYLGLLSSVFHQWWAITYSSTLESRTNYSPTDCFETFPQPELAEAVGKAGGALDSHRRALMLDRWEGLTKTYNRVHDPDERAEDITELRRRQVELDHAVAVAYGWDDLPMDHDFHDTRQGLRYTLAPATRTELLDRLLELNHERAAAEAAAGLTRKRRGGARRRPVNGQTSLEAL